MNIPYIFRTGIGFDVHKVEATDNPENFIVMGGAKIKHDKIVIAHSDGDVLIHAIMDAILGACALNDIGYYFPPTDDKFKNADSMMLLREVVKLITEKGFKLINLDSVIMCERPKILPYRDLIRENIAKVVGLDITRIGVKATTTEKLGFVGRGEGIAAQASATVMEQINEMD
jgi:2-C-methyl-D-erythritol 2,4-cyclodiphosphate synthase